MKPAIVLIAATLAAPAFAEETDLGASLYREHCFRCHGAEGKGDGPMNDILTIGVPDLSGLAERNGGEYPMFYVIQTIDGRTRTRGHDDIMPTFGGLFRDELTPLIGPSGSEAVMRGRTAAIAEYVMSLQN